MASIAKSIEIDLPVSTVYNQWTQFEEFPKFMSGIRSVVQLDDKRLHWVAEIAGRTEEWDAEIFEQTPDQKIAWRSIGGKENAGIVRFDKMADNRTRVELEMFYEPEGIAEKAADALGVVSGRVSGDLKRFKEFIEGRQVESGAWRGEIRGGEVTDEADTLGGTRAGSTPNLSRGEPDTKGVMLHGNTPGTGTLQLDERGMQASDPERRPSEPLDEPGARVLGAEADMDESADPIGTRRNPDEEDLPSQP